MTNDSNDPEYITEILVNHFISKELYTASDYTIATDVLKWEIPQNYYDDGLWNLDWEEAPYQLFLLLSHLATIPGTDHGAASSVMLFGPALNGSGFVGNHPDLSTWDEDDNLIPSSDFRDIYNTVLTEWFCLNPSIVSTILLNETYETLNLGLTCEALSTSDFSNAKRFAHVAI